MTVKSIRTITIGRECGTAAKAVARLSSVIEETIHEDIRGLVVFLEGNVSGCKDNNRNGIDPFRENEIVNGDSLQTLMNIFSICTSANSCCC